MLSNSGESYFRSLGFFEIKIWSGFEIPLQIGEAFVTATWGFTEIYRGILENGSLFTWVVVPKKKYFHPYLGKIPILTNIFQRG